MRLYPLLFLLLLENVCSFNLNTNNTLVYKSVNEGDYFGFSIGLYPGSENDDPWLLVGAPKSKAIMEGNASVPGAVYKCPIKEPCRKLKLDYTFDLIKQKFQYINYLTIDKNTFNEISDCLVKGDCSAAEGKMDSLNARKYSDYYDSAMLGMSLDVTQDQFIICSPRVKIYYPSMPVFLRIYGFCYWGASDKLGTKSTRTIVPLFSRRNDGEFLKAGNNNDTTNFHFIWAQAGFSTQLYKEGRSVILGAPTARGIELGAVVVYKDLSKFEAPEKTWFRREETKYLGYAVSIGRYYSTSEEYYAAGAPGSDSNGQVVIGRKNYAKEILKVEQAEGAEHFGAALASGDLNGDGLDDLLVGAPLYSNLETLQNEGRVFVYLGSNSGKMKRPKLNAVINGKHKSGRFGLTIACIGDMDRDGYEDFAIAAPYADADSGEVQIFYGSKEGLMHQQTLKGREIYPGLSGFGYSISRGQDIDRNGYKDIAIGSYRSGHAVIFRSYRVVTLNISMDFAEQALSVNATSVLFKYCIKYDGKSKPKLLDVAFELKLDDRLTAGGILSNVVTVFDGNSTCISENFTVHRQTVKIPIKVTGRFGVVCDKARNKSSVIIPTTNATHKLPASDLFDVNCAVLRDKFVEASAEISFLLDCGNKSYCQPNFTIIMTLHNKQDPRKSEDILVGSDEASLNLRIENKGDHAFNTTVHIQLPESLNISESCEKINETTICNVGNLFAGSSWSQQMYITQDKLSGEALNFAVEVAADADVLSRKLLATSFSVPLTYAANISVFGIKKDETYLFSLNKKAINMSSRVQTSFEYLLEKSGPSPLSEVILIVSIPVAKNTTEIKKFVTIWNPQFFETGECKFSDAKITHPSKERNTTYEKSETLFIDCISGEWLCQHIQCTISLPTKTQSASLKIDIEIETSLLESNFKSKSFILFESAVKAEVTQPKNVQGQSIGFDRVSVVMFQPSEAPKVAYWVYAAAGAGALLLLLLISSGLAKAGFFDRKIHDEIKVMKRQTGTLATQRFTVEEVEGRIEQLFKAEPEDTMATE
ncbi:integrin alpha-4-like [Neocloeon triangulifer]|uniref:integrin alpha-4-like n=1 Tax=Neocloeon triangulifer TaxID=2078957 RepID=UPI00286EDBB5|nr:integrin alpha-4-like [Neocloeon triangulifer]